MGTVRAELAFPLENRGGAPPRSRAGWRRSRSRSASRRCSTARRRALAAASCSASRSAPRWPAARGSCCSTSRPRSSTRSPATSWSGCCGGSTRSGGRRSCSPSTASSAAWPHADRVVALARRGASPATRRRARSSSGPPSDAPALQTPAARLFARAGLRPPPRGVKEARATLRAHGLLDAGRRGQPAAPAPPAAARRRARGDAASPSRPRRRGTSCRGGRAILRGVDLAVAPGRARRADGAQRRGQVDAAAPPRRPARADARARRGGRARRAAAPEPRRLPPARARRRRGLARRRSTRVGLAALADRHPRDLSGGERQRLALAIVLDGGEPPACRAASTSRRAAWTARRRASSPTACARSTARRARRHPRRRVRRRVRRARRPAGRRARRSPTRPVAEVLAGGWYFATETARILGGAGGALTPEEGAALPRAGMTMEVRAVSWQLASFAVLGLALAAGFAWYERAQPVVAGARARRHARRAGGARARRLRAAAERQADDRHRAAHRLRARRRARASRSARSRALASNLVFGQGPWTPWQMARLGAGAACSAPALGAARGRPPRPRAAGRSPAGGRAALRGDPRLLDVGDVLAARTRSAGYLAFSAHVAAVQRRPRGRQRRLLPGLRAGASCARCCASARASTVRWEPRRRPAARSRPRWRSRRSPAPARAATAGAPTCAPRRTATAASARRRGAALDAALLRVGGDGPRAAGGRRDARVARYLAARRAARSATSATSSARSSGSSPQGALAAARRRRDLVARLLRAPRAATARGRAWSTARRSPILALRAARAGGAPGRARGRAGSRARPNRDGGFNFAGRGGAERDRRHRRRACRRWSPPAGRRGRAVRRAVRFLVAPPEPRRRLRPAARAAPSNAQSTAWAVQALVAAGRDPGRVRRGGSRTPLAYLRTLIAADGASATRARAARRRCGSPAQALTALARRPLPDPAPRRQAVPRRRRIG